MFGKALQNALERGAAMTDEVPGRDFSEGGESSKASDKDSDEDLVDFESPLQNSKGGSGN
jgi:hypothetical protein